MQKEKDVTPKQRIDKLRKLIAYHRTLYYAFDAPEISDAAFDSLLHELEKLEKEFPQYASKVSPTQTVGARPLKSFIKVPHQTPMLSFVDAFLPEELHAWLKRAQNYIGKDFSTSARATPLFYCELKIDGLAIELLYENGILTRALTRGNGYIGEDVTQNIQTISDIPQKLEQLGAWEIPPRVIIRGEVFITKDVLARMNAEQKKQDKKLYANTRNLAAGSLRQLDSAITASRNLKSFQYDIVSPLPFSVATHEEYHHILASWGCTINSHNRAVRTIDEVCAFRDMWGKKRDILPYEIDGVVVILNDNELFEHAGIVGRAPRGAIAYKFKALEATTIMRDIRIQVGRSGVLTPVAELNPVALGGVTISHATLHNFDEIKRLDARIGDTVIVTRSGDVIPKITGVIKELRSGKEKPVVIPTRCPIDGSPLTHKGVFVKCSNRKCGARNRNTIIHFVSRGAFDIRGLGKKIIDRFLDEGLIGDAGDIFSLEMGDIENLERFGEKSARNLIKEIQHSKQITIDRFLYALGIPQIGEETARTLAQKVQTDISKKISIATLTKTLQSYSIELLQKLPDVGPKVAQSIYEWFLDSHNQSLLHKLESASIELVLKKQSKTGSLYGKTICITGTLQSISRSRAKELLEKEGGVFHPNISREVTVVVVGENAGSKLQKAKELGIEIWDEKTFLKKLKITAPSVSYEIKE